MSSGRVGGVSDTGEQRRLDPVDPVDRAHLTSRANPSPPVYRYAASPDLTDLAQRYWIPVWSLPRPSNQSTLQYPVFLIVVSTTYARLYGVSRGRSTVTLDGDGWGVGTLFRPAAGRLLLGASAATLTDGWIDLRQVPGLDADSMVAQIRGAMSGDPHAEQSHRDAIVALERRYRALLPVDEAGLLVNHLVDWIEEHREVTRVGELAAEARMSERSLQRLVEQRVGLTPKWLIQRRRLHDAVEHLKAGTRSLGDLAAELGYADQAHFTHDFRAVTGMTPGEYSADQKPTRR